MTRLIGNRTLPGGFRLLQVGTSELAAQARPGHWFSVQPGELRFCLPALDASAQEGWIAFQLPPAAPGHVRDLPYGSPCTLQGPLGAPVNPPPGERQLVLLADESGLPATLFCSTSAHLQPSLVLLELKCPTPPVRLWPSRFLLTGLPAGTIAGVAPLEAAGIPSRISHPDPLPGCTDEPLDRLLYAWLDAHTAEQRWHIAVAAIGQQGFLQRMVPLLRGRVGQHSLHLLPSLTP